MSGTRAYDLPTGKLLKGLSTLCNVLGERGAAVFERLGSEDAFARRLAQIAVTGAEPATTSVECAFEIMGDASSGGVAVDLTSVERRFTKVGSSVRDKLLARGVPFSKDTLALYRHTHILFPDPGYGLIDVYEQCREDIRFTGILFDRGVNELVWHYFSGDTGVVPRWRLISAMPPSRTLNETFSAQISLLFCDEAAISLRTLLLGIFAYSHAAKNGTWPDWDGVPTFRTRDYISKDYGGGCVNLTIGTMIEVSTGGKGASFDHGLAVEILPTVYYPQ